jgi:uncharacterized RDD family membrane protein YckC
MEQEPLKKQVLYANFYPRVFASMIDLLLSSIAMMPVFVVISAVIYGNNPPAKIMGPLWQETLKHINEQHISASAAFSSFLHDPHLTDYLIHQGALIKMLLDQSLQLLIFAIVVILFWTYRSATPGKMILSLKVVDAHTFGPLSKKQQIIRFFAYSLSVLPFCLGFFWVAFDKKKQAFHDKLAGSVVIKN